MDGVQPFLHYAPELVLAKGVLIRLCLQGLEQILILGELGTLPQRLAIELIKRILFSQLLLSRVIMRKFFI